MNLTTKELRNLLNKAWDKGSIDEYEVYGWNEKYSCHAEAMRSRRYRNVKKIIKEAEAVDWGRLSKPDNVEANIE